MLVYVVNGKRTQLALIERKRERDGRKREVAAEP